MKKCLVNELGANLHNISLLVSNRGLYASARTPTNICNTYTTQNKYKYVTTELRAQIYMPIAHIDSVLSSEWQILHDCVIIVACFTSYQSGVQFFCQVSNLLANRTLASMSGSVSDTTGVSPRNFVVVLGILSWITWIQFVLWWNIHAHHNLEGPVYSIQGPNMIKTNHQIQRDSQKGYNWVSRTHDLFWKFLTEIVMLAFCRHQNDLSLFCRPS